MGKQEQQKATQQAAEIGTVAPGQQTSGGTMDSGVLESKTEDAPKAEEKPANRWDAIFGRPVFAASRTQKTYESESNGELSMKLADVIVPYTSGVGYVPGSVKAKRKKDAPESATYIEFAFFRNLTTLSVNPSGVAATAELEDWKDRTVADFETWFSQQEHHIAPPPPATRPAPKGITLTAPVK